MKIQVVSDLHLEFADIELKNWGCDVLVLSGDIMLADRLDRRVDSNSVLYQRFRGFMDRVSRDFKHIVYVAGNHEFYGSKWQKALDILHDFCAQYPNVYFLERECKFIDGIGFIGSTLWTSMNKGDPLTLHATHSMMNDYRAITNDDKGFRKLRPADTVERHRESLGYIKQVVAEPGDKRFVVVGHHAPSFASISDECRDQSLMNGAYASDLFDFIFDRPQIALWTHGHIHERDDYWIGTTRVVCNPRGYVGHEPHAQYWDGNCIVEI